MMRTSGLPGERSDCRLLAVWAYPQCDAVVDSCGEEPACAAVWPDNACSGDLILYEVCAAGHDGVLVAIHGCTDAVVCHGGRNAVERRHGAGEPDNISVAIVHGLEVDVGDGAVEVSDWEVMAEAFKGVVPRIWEVARGHNDATSRCPTGSQHDVEVVDKPVPGHGIECATTRPSAVDLVREPIPGRGGTVPMRQLRRRRTAAGVVGGDTVAHGQTPGR